MYFRYESGTPCTAVWDHSLDPFLISPLLSKASLPAPPPRELGLSLAGFPMTQLARVWERGRHREGEAVEFTPVQDHRHCGQQTELSSLDF